MIHTQLNRIVVSVCSLLIAAFSNQAQAEPILTIGSGEVGSGSYVEIPISFNNERAFTAFQFDLTFEPDFFDEVDTSRCFNFLADDGLLAECRRQDWPNQDVIRFLAVSLTGEPIPSGEIGSLFFQAREAAVSGVSPLELLECTSLAVNSDQEEIAFTAEDYTPGEIVVFGQEPPTKPKTPEAVLILDGQPIFSEKPLYRQQFDIPNPIPVLAAGHDELTLTLPEGDPIKVASKRFIPRNGYVDRLDCNDTKVPDNDPSTPLSFRWYGEMDGNGWLGVTVVDNIVRGSLVTDQHSYQLTGSPEEGYRLKQIDPTELPSAHGDQLSDQFEKFAGVKSSRTIKIGADAPLLSKIKASRSTGPVQLDLLIMYTAQAENDAGGPGGLNALIQQSIDNTNQALINSGYSDLSVQEVHRELLIGFVPSGNMPQDGVDDRDLLRVNPQILAARDAYYADLMIVMLRDVINDLGDFELAFCGITYVQSPTCGSPGEFPDCGVGMNFVDYAFTWVSTQCANLPGRNSFPHEIGHMMGGEHPPGRGQTPANASFPWSYAHFRETGSSSLRFGTVMWVPNPITQIEVPQPLNFSNPDILTVGGQPSGIVNQRDNIRTFEALAPTMEDFRIPPPELIFADSFESP